MENDIRNFSAFLLEAMRTRGVSIEKLSQFTGISERFITLFIEERYEKLPSLPYVRGYLLKIGDALGVDGKSLWEQYLIHNEAIRRSGRNDQLPGNRFAVRRIDKKIVVGVLGVLVVALYALFRLPAMLGSPRFELTNLPDNLVLEASLFTIQGKTEPEHHLTLNGEQIYPDEMGLFSKDVQLQPGFNTFIFSVKKLLGKEHVVTRQVFYKAPEEKKDEKNIKLDQLLP